MTITGDTTEATFEAAWNEWHTERERYYGDPLGWVSITGLYWLTDESETVADLPGRWRADANTVYVEGIDGTVLSLRSVGLPIRATTHWSASNGLWAAVRPAASPPDTGRQTGAATVTTPGRKPGCNSGRRPDTMPAG